MPNLEFQVSSKMGDMSGINKLRDVMKEIEESAKRTANMMAGFNISSVPMASGGTAYSGTASAHQHSSSSSSSSSSRSVQNTPQTSSGLMPRSGSQQTSSQQAPGPKYDFNTQNGLYQWDTQVFAPIQSLIFGFNKSLGSSTPSIVTQTQKQKIDDSSLLNWFTSLDASAVKNNKEMDQLYSKVFDHYESSGNFLVKEGRGFYQKYGKQLGAPNDIETTETTQKQISAQKLLGNSAPWQVGSTLGNFVKSKAPFITAAGATAWGLSQLSQGYGMWKQNSAPVDALAHSLRTTVKSVEDFRQQIDYAGAKFGQTLQQSAASAALLTQSFGNLGQAGITNLTGSTARFSYNNGLTSQQGAQITATSAQLGITSGVGSTMTTDQFQNALSNAANQAGMSGRQGQFMTGFLDIANQVGASNPIIANPNALLGMYTQLNKSGIQGLQGLRGASILNQFNQSAMTGNYSSQDIVFAAMQNVLGVDKFKKLSPVQILEAQQGGISAFVPGTKTTIGKAVMDLLRSRGLSKDQQVITLASFFGGNLNKSKTFLDAAGNDFGSYNPSTTDTQKFWKSLYDKQQINEQTKNVGQSGAGSIFAYPSIAWNALGFGGQAGVAAVGGIFGAKALGKAGGLLVKGAKGVGGRLLGAFSKAAPTIAESGGAVVATEGLEAAGAAGLAGGLEEAGLAADTTGFGLPVGLLLNLAGLAVGGYAAYKATKGRSDQGSQKAQTSTISQQSGESTLSSNINSMTIESLKINQLQVSGVNGNIGSNSTLANLFSNSDNSSLNPGINSPFWNNFSNDAGIYFDGNSYKTPKNKSDFVDQMYPYATEVSKATGIPALYLLSQWGNESNFGKSEAATENINFAGIVPFDQYKAGKNNAYAGFKSLEEFAQADITVLNNARYAGARADAKNGASPKQVGYDLASEGYATADPSSYGQAMSSIAKEIGYEFERVIGKYMRKFGVQGPIVP